MALAASLRLVYLSADMGYGRSVLGHSCEVVRSIAAALCRTSMVNRPKTHFALTFKPDRLIGGTPLCLLHLRNLLDARQAQAAFAAPMVR